MVKGEPFDVERVALKSLASGYGVFECRISCSWECMWDSVRRACFGKKNTSVLERDVEIMVAIIYFILRVIIFSFAVLF